MLDEQEQHWYFTWGFGQEHPNCYTKIWGTFSSARDEMIRRYGDKWAFQYESADSAGVDRWNLKEIK
jgi:hypothetical protein